MESFDVTTHERKVATVREYERPSITVLGSIQELTLQLDKIGSSPDALASPSLDGSIVPDVG